ncbi:hypothetical protein AALB64_13045 [Lachnospiraceae bacterium 45-P1]
MLMAGMNVQTRSSIIFVL